MTILLLIAAGVIWLWPRSADEQSRQSQYVPTPAELKPPQPVRPTYQTSLIALSTVRSRLLNTDHLNDTCRSSIDAIVLALVAGCDKE